MPEQGQYRLTGVATSVAAFLGRADKGPFNTAIRVLSYPDFEHMFGPPHPGSELAVQVRLFFLNGGCECYIVRITDATGPKLTNYLGNTSKNTGLYSLGRIDLFNLMIIPKDNNLNDPDDYLTLWKAASTYCRDHRALLLIDPPGGWKSPDDVIHSSTGVGRLRNSVMKDHCALFFPDIVIRENGRNMDVGPSGAIAGLIARTDRSWGVWKAPAGINAPLIGIDGLKAQLTESETQVLTREGVNCIRSFPQGIVTWGARTLNGADTVSSTWKYIPVKRLAMFLEESIVRGTKWAVFEPNNEPLWAQMRLNIGAFMQRLFLQGAFGGQKPEEAYFVKCDKETTTQSNINQGIVTIIIGFAPLKPAEFIIIKIQQRAGKI